jgi:hypothetical protein
MSTCPFVITKGNRQGQTCSERTKPGIKYCRTHLRNLGVKRELGVLPVCTNSTPETDFQPSVPKEINSDYKTPIPKGKLPKLKPDPEAKKSAFIDAFNKNLDSKLDATVSELDMKTVYDELDVADDVDEELEEELEDEIDDNKYQALKKELQFEKEQNLKAQRRINSMFTMKQCLFTGVKAVSDIAEHVAGENLKGYSETVMKSNEVNALMDEMSEDLEVLIGFTDLPCSVRLILTMGILGSTVYTKNMCNIVVREPDPRNQTSNNTNNTPNDNNKQTEKVEPSFSPVYTN